MVRNRIARRASWPFVESHCPDIVAVMAVVMWPVERPIALSHCERASTGRWMLNDAGPIPPILRTSRRADVGQLQRMVWVIIALAIEKVAWGRCWTARRIRRSLASQKGASENGRSRNGTVQARVVVAAAWSPSLRLDLAVGAEVVDEQVEICLAIASCAIAARTGLCFRPAV